MDRKLYVSHLLTWLASPSGHFALALAAEALWLLSWFFLALFALEMLLPTFVTERVNLGLYAGTLFVGILFLALLSEKAGVSFPETVRFGATQKVLLTVFSVSVLLLALLKYPADGVLLIGGGLLASGLWWWRHRTF